MTTKRFYRVSTGDPRRDELRAKYRDADEILHEPIHNHPRENPRYFGEVLDSAVRRMAARGLTDAAIAKELGVSSLNKTRKVREFLGCAGTYDMCSTRAEGARAAEEALLQHEDDTPPEAA